MIMPMKNPLIILTCLAATLLLAGCGKPDAREVKPAPLVETISSGPVVLTMSAEPPLVRLDSDIFLTVKVESPSGVEVRLPPIEDRLTGFTLQGSFDRDPVKGASGIVKERSFRLSPALAEEYRIGPMAVTVVDGRKQPAEESWFATRPLQFESAPLAADDDSSERGIIGPVCVLPSFKTIVGWILTVLAAAAVCAGLWFLLRRIRRAVRLHRMSPRERALSELEELIARDLVGKRRVKDFYAELTMIVRRYIERAHKIRAPEQTTEEFLAAAAAYPGFNREVVHKLSDFLRSADLVKFAAFQPEPSAITRALDTARDYIRTDERVIQQEGKDDV